jgi:serine/threonine-protein kinase
MALAGNAAIPIHLGFEILETLGHGARSTIYLVREKSTTSRYALKRVIRNSAADQRFVEQALLEHEVAQQFNHPSLRKSHRVFKIKSFFRIREVYILMEAVDGLTLEQRRPTNMLEVCRIFQDTAIALGVMHRAGFVHADIKPNNILVTSQDMVKIIDFGQSCPTGTRKERIQGTPDYIAPEQVKREHITPKTDVFNLAATMYFVLTQQHVPTLIPKGGAGMNLVDRGPTKCPSPMELNPDVPPALSGLIMNCLEQEPRERPESMTRVYERLEMAIGQIKTESGGGSTQKVTSPIPPNDGMMPNSALSDTGSLDIDSLFA